MSENKTTYEVRIKRRASSGFQSPNYTQTPNDFFALLPCLSDAELRVTMVMIRKTFGYHRQGFKMGLNKLADAAGLSRNGAKVGAEEAEQRGTFRRTNPGEQGAAEWELIVDDGWSASDQAGGQPGGQPVTTPWSASDQQSGVKESIKKDKENEDEAMSIVSKAYSSEIGMLTPMIADSINGWIKDGFPVKWMCDAIHEAAVQNKRSWKYCEAIIKRWDAQGNQNAIKRPTTVSSGSTKQDQSLANIQNWLDKKAAQNV